MKRLLSLLIKIGIPAAVIYFAVSTNPELDAHLSAITAKIQTLQNEDILGQTDRMIFGNTPSDGAETPLRYQNYFVYSKVKGPEDETVSYGFLNQVYVMKNEL